MFDVNKKKILQLVGLLVLGCVVFGAGFFIGKAQVVCPICTPNTIDFSLFWDAYNKLHENFINPDKIVDQKVVYGAIGGMTQSLGDPYTAFFDPTQAKTFEQDLAGSFGGIGIEVGIQKGQMTIVAPLKGTPGDKAGLKSGDQIIKINGQSTADMPSDQAVNLIRGKVGTSVTLTIFRDGWKETKDFTVTRDTINIPSVDWKLEDGDVAYIHIYQFDQTLSPDFQKIAFEILKSPAKKIVLDVRDNPGGYLEVAQDVAGWFLQTGQVVTIEDFGKGKAQQQYKAEGNAAFGHYPMVVLMNKGSASASEILAGALRDDRNIQLIGEKSFGKGSVQEVVTLRDGVSFLKITIAKWLTPKGNSISEVGLNPDVKVTISDADATANKDPQLQKALEIVKGLQ
jgi:carboxyl-terminal processing protease